MINRSGKYDVLANIVFLAHIAFGLWLLVGWLFDEWRLVYLVTLFIWIGSWVFMRHCALTVLEFWLRKKAGVGIDTEEEFIHHYIKKFFGFDIPMPLIFIGGMIAFGVLLCLSFINKPFG